jgi:1-acyl-sn-glycerol-3-phosphate acyltransferase
VTAAPLRHVPRGAGVARDLALLWSAARLVAPRLDPARRRALSHRFARRTLATLGLRVTRLGALPPPDEPVLVVANHVSWLDVYLLNASRAMRFVAKDETRTWPLVGTIAARFDSLFIVRGSCRDAARVKARVAAALAAGESVAVFPEATTTAGHGVKPFYGAMFQAAIDAGVRVVPVAIRYPAADGRPNPAAAFVDDMTFAASLLRVLGEPALRAELRVGAPLAAVGRSRRELAAAAHGVIAAALALPAAPPTPAQLRRGSWWRGPRLRPVAGGRPSLAAS